MLTLKRATREQIKAACDELVSSLQADYGNIPKDPPLRAGEASAVYGERPSELAWRIFEKASPNWFREIMEIRGQFNGMSGDTFSDATDSLATFGYATIHTAKTFKPGGQIKFFLPTRLGIEKMKEAHVPFMEVRGDAPHGADGDGTHIYYQNRVGQKLAANGWNVEIEQTLRKKRVDLGATRGEIMHAYEIVNDNVEKEIHNLIADLDDGWNRVVFCVGNERTKRELKEMIRANFPLLLANCDFALLETFR